MTAGVVRGGLLALAIASAAIGVLGALSPFYHDTRADTAFMRWREHPSPETERAWTAARDYAARREAQIRVGLVGLFGSLSAGLLILRGRLGRPARRPAAVPSDLDGSTTETAWPAGADRPGPAPAGFTRGLLAMVAAGIGGALVMWVAAAALQALLDIATPPETAAHPGHRPFTDRDLLVVIAAWAVGTLAAAWLAGRVDRERRLLHGVVAAMLLLCVAAWFVHL